MDGLLNPSDSVEHQRDKLVEICGALMKRVQQAPNESSTAYVQFERAALLEEQVRTRTADLERALDLLNDSNAQLAEANHEIETARGHLNEALESMEDGFALFDRHETLLLFNSRFCELLGDVKENLTPGLPFRNFVDRVSRSKYLDLPDNVKPRDWAKQRLTRHQDQRVVFNIGLMDDRWLQVGEHRTKQGGTVILQTDVTDIMREQRKERATLVDAQSKMLRATLDHLDQGICIFNNQAMLVGWNQKLERMMQMAVPRVRVRMKFDKLVDLLCSRMVFSDGTNKNDLKNWSNQTDDRAPITLEMTDESGQIFSVFAQEMPDHGFVISFTDVTQQHRYAEALRDMNKTLEQRVAARTMELGDALENAKRANDSKSRFVAAASHDLLQPLSAAKLFAATLLDSGLGEEATDISRKVVSALTSVEDIIEALLDISKLDVGQATFDVQDVNLSDIFASLESELAPAAETKGLTLKVMPTHSWVVSDPVFLRRILQNLIINAIRYTDEGRVLVGTRRIGEAGLKLQVFDTGEGIAEEDQSRIFEEFARLAPSHSGANGLGLGLAIVDRACRSLGHQLELTSTVGKGSCFSVTVEATEMRSMLPHLRARPTADPTPLAGKIFLLVENDPALASAIEMRLEGWGGHVIQVQSGKAALEMLEEIDIVPDALVLDFQLDDGMTGLELFCLICDRCGTLPAVMISANRTSELKLGCELLDLPLLTKPLAPVKFLQTLQRICADQTL